MRTKYIGFVKTSFSSPSLPFRIGGYAPGKNSQFPSFTHPPRTSILRSRRIRKRSKAAFRKSQHAHKAKRFFSSLPGLVPCPNPVFESAKGRRTRLCKKSDKKLGRNTRLPPSFLFFSPLFQRTTPFINRFLEEETPNTYDNSANTLTRETAPDRHSYAKTNDDTTSRCRFCAQPTAQLACVSHPPSVSFAHKKTATHLPMDSCLKECGR